MEKEELKSLYDKLLKDEDFDNTPDKIKVLKIIDQINHNALSA